MIYDSRCDFGRRGILGEGRRERRGAGDRELARHACRRRVGFRGHCPGLALGYVLGYVAGRIDENVVVFEALAVEALDREGRRVAGERCSGMVARKAVAAGVGLEGAHRTQGDAAVAAEGEREVEIKIIGFGVRWERVQVADFARNIITVLVVVDARKLALVAAALVLAIGCVSARGAAVADLDPAGAKRAAVFGENMSRRWRVVERRAPLSRLGHW